MNIQIIKENNTNKFAVIEWNDFIRISQLLKEDHNIDLTGDTKKTEDTIIINEKPLNPLKKFRQENELSQKELADMLDVSQPYIAKLEKKQTISKKTMHKIEKSVSKNSSLLKGIIKLFS
jgi:DNA-binding XRE family transcriptional regulator